MPFVTKEERLWLASDNKKVPETPGQWCYLFYRDMMHRWRGEPRWYTADAIYDDVRAYERGSYPENQKRACSLAWQVFMALNVMPYELKMRKKNGDI